MATSNVDERNIGKNIAYLRKIRGLTQGELADRMHITQSAVSKFELHGDNIRTETLWKIADALNVFPMFLLHQAIHDESAPTHDVMLRAIKNYPAENQHDKYIEMLKQKSSGIELRNKYKADSLSSLCMSIFDSLNTKGKNEAVKRLNELAQLDQYKKED